MPIHSAHIKRVSVSIERVILGECLPACCLSWRCRCQPSWTGRTLMRKLSVATRHTPRSAVHVMEPRSKEFPLRRSPEVQFLERWREGTLDMDLRIHPGENAFRKASKLDTHFRRQVPRHSHIYSESERLPHRSCGPYAGRHRKSDAGRKERPAARTRWSPCPDNRMFVSTR